MSIDQIIREQINEALKKFGAELTDALDTRIYWSREMNLSHEAATLEDVKDAVNSAVEEATRESA